MDNPFHCYFPDVKILHDLLGDKRLKELGLLQKILFLESNQMSIAVADGIADGKKTKFVDTFLIENPVLIDSCFRLDPAWPVINYYYRRCCGSDCPQNECEQAISQYLLVSKQCPKFNGGYYRLAKVYFNSGDYKQALQTIRDMSTHIPAEYFPSLKMRVKIHLYEGQKDSANYYCKLAESGAIGANAKFKDYWLSDIYQSYGKYYYEHGDYKTAIPFFERLKNGSYEISDANQYEDYAPGKLWQARCYIRMNEMDSAYGSIEQLIIKNAGKPWIYGTIVSDPEVSKIKKSPEYVALMKKYFPDQYKE